MAGQKNENENFPWQTTSVTESFLFSIFELAILPGQLSEQHADVPWRSELTRHHDGSLHCISRLGENDKIVILFVASGSSYFHVENVNHHCITQIIVCDYNIM